jgi:hypothetical protein
VQADTDTHVNKKNSMYKDNCDKKILDTMLTYSIRLIFSFKYLVKILRNSMTIVLKKKLGTMLTCSTRQAFSFKDLVDYYHIKKKHDL